MDDTQVLFPFVVLDDSSREDPAEAEEDAKEEGDTKLERISASSSDISMTSLGDFERYFKEEDDIMDFNNNCEESRAQSNVTESGVSSPDELYVVPTSEGEEDSPPVGSSDTSTVDPLCVPSPLSPAPAPPPLPTVSNPVISKCSKPPMAKIRYNPAIPRTKRGTIDKIRLGDRSVTIVKPNPDFPHLRRDYNPIFKSVHREMEMLEKDESDDSLLDYGTERLEGGWTEAEMVDPDDCDPLEQDNRWPEFPGLKDSDIMSSTICISECKDPDNPSDSVLRGESNRSPSLKASTEEDRIEKKRNVSPPKANTSRIPQSMKASPA